MYDHTGFLHRQVGPALGQRGAPAPRHRAAPRACRPIAAPARGRAGRAAGEPDLPQRADVVVRDAVDDLPGRARPGPRRRCSTSASWPSRAPPSTTRASPILLRVLRDEDGGAVEQIQRVLRSPHFEVGPLADRARGADHHVPAPRPGAPGVTAAAPPPPVPERFRGAWKRVSLAVDGAAPGRARRRRLAADRAHLRRPARPPLRLRRHRRPHVVRRHDDLGRPVPAVEPRPRPRRRPAAGRQRRRPGPLGRRRPRRDRRVHRRRPRRPLHRGVAARGRQRRPTSRATGRPTAPASWSAPATTP